MDQLPPSMLDTVPHVIFGIFNLAIPSIIAWAGVVAVFFLSAWSRLPKIFEPAVVREEVDR
ncbi:MAG: hypothetical protein P8Z42_04510 [Anaerolineales bacterium]|jgi:hypothetical protein